MANSITLTSIDPQTFELQNYSPSDNNLITNFTIDSSFNPETDYISYFIYNLNGFIEGFRENYRGYTIQNQALFVYPEKDVVASSLQIGEYNIVYYFLQNQANSSPDAQYFISEISSDRTELRLSSTEISDALLLQGGADLILKQTNSQGVFLDFYLNFGLDSFIIANNLLIDNTDPTNPTLLVKLYEALPEEFGINNTCYFVTEVADPIGYNVDIQDDFSDLFVNPQLSGPNFNLNIKDQINNSTPYTNYQTLTSQSYAVGSGSLQYQVNSILAERGIEINVDYSNYSNFIYFSSAQTRLENFYYKLSLIEEYQYSASLTDNTGSGFVSSSQNLWNSKIDEIITTFDGYDYYLYYNSGSTAWPKVNSQYPYINASTANPGAGYTWFLSQSAVATTFDEANNNALINAIPGYLREDTDNADFELFVEMLGEMFDNIWLYYQDVTEKWNADNRLQYGVSKEIVADILRDLGLKIYQSNFSSTDLYLAFLGVTPEGNQFPFPYITGSYPVPTGYEYIDTKISASNEVVPLEDVQKSFYKRLFHNLPFLLKKKGTTTGLQSLLTTYGVPDTILRVAEFGGKDKIETNDWDYWQHKYNLAHLAADANHYIATDFALNSSWTTQYTTNRPETISFRFKTIGLDYALANNVQNLFIATDGGDSSYINLVYPSSSLTSGSYSGSIPNPYDQKYAYLNFIPDAANPSVSASIYLPFLDEGWWSVALTYTGSDIFTLYAANNIYDGDDGSTIGFIGSASVVGDEAIWNVLDQAYFISNAGSSFPNGGTFFSGSLQEIRYYSNPIDVRSFKDFVMNPDSIKTDGLNGASNYLAFRAALGGELYTGSVSIHPKVTGSWITTSSFNSDSNFTINTENWVSNYEYLFLNQPAVGIRNIISNKIQVVEPNLPAGNTLSQYISVQQKSTGSLYTENSTYTEIAFSPQNEINDDIMGQLGFFNMGDYIGDPRQRFDRLDYYPDLDRIRNNYFEKYQSNYNIFEYINLIKYFDNSLFKMIKDFTPARSSLASGVVVKQTILERSKYPEPLVAVSQSEFTGSIDTAFIEGGPGGSTPILANGGITKVEVLDGGFGYTGSASTYPISIIGGGGQGAVLTPNITLGGVLSVGTILTPYIIQNSYDVPNGNNTILGYLEDGVSYSFNYSASSNTITFIEARQTFSPYYDLEKITFKAGDLGSTTDVIVQAPYTILSSISDGYISSVQINNPGKDFTSFPTLSITGTTGSDAILEVTELDNSIVTQTWYGNNVTPYGLVPFTQSTAVEFYNGEYSGSLINVDNGGELNLANPVKQVSTIPLSYYSTGSATAINPSPGQFFWRAEQYAVGGGISPDGPAGLKYMYINETDANGVNILQALQNLNPGDTMTFTIVYDQTVS